MVDLSMQHTALRDKIQELVKGYLESVYAVDHNDVVVNNIIINVSSIDISDGGTHTTTYIDGHRGLLVDQFGKLIASTSTADAVMADKGNNSDFDFIIVSR